MKTIKSSVLYDMIKHLEKYREFFAENITEWETQAGMYLGDGKYSIDEKSIERIRLGDKWTASYDCARWFRASIVLPDKYLGKKLYLEIDFGGEILVKINGKIAGAVSSKMNSGWVHRDVIFLETPKNKDEKIEIELEATVDSGGFCDAAMDGATSFDYYLQKARVVAIDEKCEAFLFDINLIGDALNHISDTYIKNHVYEVFDEALHIVDFDFDEKTVRSSIYNAKDYIDKKLSEIAHLPQCNVIMQGHSHIDIAWLWRYQETQRKAARTFSNNLALMERYPDFTFSQSQAILYDMTKRLYPDIYEKIKEKVKSGQWDIVGNVWVEADTNIASGEALIRQLLYGREFFKKEFGKTSDIYWLPDCFGFSWALPQIIKRSGMKYFLTSKLNSQDTNRFPHNAFRWKGIDGSTILAYMQRVHYQSDYTPQDLVKAAQENDQSDVLTTSFGMFGYGDGGGGCTYGMVERGRRLNRFPGLPSSEIGHIDDFFAKVDETREKLPEYNDELYYENHRGTYTSQAFIKKGNRKGEIVLREAETACVFAFAKVGYAYDMSKLEEAWKLLLKNQFHDILPGTSIHEAMEDCRPDYEKLLKDGEKIKTDALMAINSNIETEKDGIIVWNILNHETSLPVDILMDKQGIVCDEKGDALIQNITKQGEKYTLSFIATDVPALGYKFFPLDNSKKEKNIANIIKASKKLLENEKIRVKLDEDGMIISVFDKENDREVLSGKGNLLTVFQDKCKHETAWNLELNYQKKYFELTKADSIELIEQSELRGVIRIVRSFNKSKITQDIILYAHSNSLEFDTRVDWQERDKVLKAAFEVDIHNNEATFETAHGAIKRPTHWNNSYDMARFEQCAHKWADLSEGDYGVSIFNDCKYGYDIKDNCMRITLLRAPTCPDRKADLGKHSFVYSLYPHNGTWQSGNTVERALDLNCPLKAFKLDKQTGQLPSTNTFIQCSGKSVIVDAVKKAQDEEGIIIRVYEPKQARGKASIALSIPFKKVTECNLMEENERDIQVNGNSFSFTIKPFEVKTFRIQ